MPQLFDVIFEYQLLLGKAQLVPLDADEQARLYGLGQLLAGDRAGDAKRRLPRVAYPSSLQFTLPGGFGVGAIKNVSGLGLAVATRKPLAVGARTVVRLEEGGVEYFFPCRVCWSRASHALGMGLAFDGVPSRASVFGDDESSGIRWRSIRLDADASEPTRRSPAAPKAAS